MEEFMKTAPQVIETPESQLSLVSHKDAQIGQQLIVDRFPVGFLTKHNRESDILMLGSVPLFLMLGIIAFFLGARLLKFTAERNDLGVNMRSSGPDSI
jgi:hypothetical protein